ncbi:MAG: tetratricopeptide repeat protein, partial [Asgard group archaeon]|nr:tetratricopeptide repeat protein [Asgard group archaeon]
MEKELDKARYFLRTKKYNEVLDIISKVEKQDETSAIIKDRIFDLKTQTLYKLGRIEEAYQEIERDIIEFTGKKDWVQVLDSMILKIRIKFIESKKDDLLEIADEGLEILKQIKKITPDLLVRKAWLLYWKGNTFTWSIENDNAIKFLKLSLKLAKELSNQEIKGLSLHRLGVVYGFLSDFEKSINYMTQALEIYEKLGDKGTIAHLYQNLSISYSFRGEYKLSREYSYKFIDLVGETPHILLGIADSYWREGELDKGLELLSKGLERLQNQLENPDEHPLVLFFQGNLLSRKGELNKALDKYHKAIKISIQKSDSSQPWGYYDIGISTCHLLKGELNEAMEYAMEALDKFGRNNKKYGLGLAHSLLMKVYYEKNDMMNALVHAQSSLDYRQEIGNKHEMALTLRWIIKLLIEEGNLEEANTYFEQIKALNKTTDDRMTDQSYRLAEALILKSKSRPKYWVKAIDILEILSEEQILNFEITITALILLSELFLNEFSMSGDEEVLTDLQTATNRVVDIAKKQNSYTLRVEAYNMRVLSLWLQAQYSKVDVDIQNTRRLLLEAQELADEKGLVKLARKIENQHIKLIEQLENWDEFIK